MYVYGHATRRACQCSSRHSHHTMNLLNRPPLLTSVLNVWLRKIHKNGDKRRTSSEDTHTDVDSGGGKALPLTPEQKEVAGRMSELQEQLAREQETSNQRQADLEAAATEIDQLKARLTQLDCLPQQVKDLQKKLEQEKDSAHKAWELYEGATAEAQQLKERLEQLEEEATRKGVRVSELEQAHADSERQRRSSVELLEARTTELREAQVFLKNDEITDNEVMHLVDTLNGQVAKTAAAVARAPQIHFESVRDAAALEKAVRRIEHYSWLPPNLLSTIRAADHTRSATLVQTALQAGMVMYARWLATTWELGVVDPRGLLEGVYLQIRERGTYLESPPDPGMS